MPNRLFEVVARYPHDRSAFTQGLVFYHGSLYESTGIRSQSSIRRLDLESGTVLAARRLDKDLFGEGLTVLENRLVQLTWKSGSAFIYAPPDLHQTGGFTFSGEGWGSTSIDGRLVISDGSALLRFLTTKNYQQTAQLLVTDRGRPVAGLNELEMVDGLIYANVYPSDCIAQIDPQSGRVVGWIDLGGLIPRSERSTSSAVANGIAFNSETGELFVTGKLWPYVFQIRLLNTDDFPNTRVALPETAG